MKVYLQYDGEPSEGTIMGDRHERAALKLKLTLPASWIEGPCRKILTFFVDSYNKKQTEAPEKQLDAESMLLHCCGLDVPLDAPVSKHIQEYNDIFIRHRPRPTEVVARPEGSLLCTNYGCGQYFLPGDNTPQSCHFHERGPVFHDTVKFWSCCPDRKAADWEEFERVPPCKVGAHSTENRQPLTQIAPPEQLHTPLTAEQVQALDAQKAALAAAAAAAESDGAPRRCGPREFEEAASTQQQQPGTVGADGRGRCRNFGCQQDFVVADNHGEACRHHTGGPVFWDTYKYWKCCPDKKCFEFDDFVKVAGCTVGPHKL